MSDSKKLITEALWKELDDLARDWKPLARKTHPEESKAAARHILPKLAQLQEEVLGFVERSPDSTASEIADVARYRDPRKAGRRLSELARAGKIFKSGSRECRITGRPAATWHVTVKP